MHQTDFHAPVLAARNIGTRGIQVTAHTLGTNLDGCSNPSANQPLPDRVSTLPGQEIVESLGSDVIGSPCHLDADCRSRLRKHRIHLPHAYRGRLALAEIEVDDMLNKPFCLCLRSRNGIDWRLGR
jgi:hypothetical protein